MDLGGESASAPLTTPASSRPDGPVRISVSATTPSAGQAHGAPSQAPPAPAASDASLPPIQRQATDVAREAGRDPAGPAAAAVGAVDGLQALQSKRQSYPPALKRLILHFVHRVKEGGGTQEAVSASRVARRTLTCRQALRAVVKATGRARVDRRRLHRWRKSTAANRSGRKVNSAFEVDVYNSLVTKVVYDKSDEKVRFARLSVALR